MIRKAIPTDIPVILKLINQQARLGIMLPRGESDILKNLDDFFVYEAAGKIIGAVSLVAGTSSLTEIRSLVVNQEEFRKGVGTALVDACLKESQKRSFSKVFVLTYAAPLFLKLGFRIVSKDNLPEKIWTDCKDCSKQDHCDEIALILELPVPIPLDPHSPVSLGKNILELSAEQS